MARTATAPGAPTTKLGKAAYELDDRMLVTPWLRRTLNKVYPDHWSFLLGEIALYSFIILLLSGTYLTFFFDASMREVVYEGSYAPLRGVEMSAAYDSALTLSFDVLSYAGTLGITVVADPVRVPEADWFSGVLQDELYAVAEVAE